MSLRYGKNYVRVFKVENKGKYAEVQFSSSRKDYYAETPDRIDEKTGRKFAYASSSWGFVRFVGDAFGKIDSLIESLDAAGEKGVPISIPEGAMSEKRESYNDKDGNRQWPKNPQMTCFNFELSDGQDTASSKASAQVDEDEFPF